MRRTNLLGWLVTVTACCLMGGASAAHAAGPNWAGKMFNKLQHDFGVVARGADVQYRFVVRNPYKQTVHIAGVRTTCGCSAATPTRRTLALNQSAEIVVTMDTRKFIRRKDSNLIVTFDKPAYAQVRIPLTAYIRTDVVLTPGSVNFGAVEQGQSASRTLSIAYAGRNDWTISGVKINNKHLSGKVKEIRRGGGQVKYQLQVTLNGDTPPGMIRDVVYLETDDANTKYVPVTVKGRVESDISVTVASLGAVSPGASKTFNVVVRGRKPFRIDNIVCPDSPDCFKAQVAKRTSTIHVVPVTFIAKDRSAGAFQDTLQMTIAGRDEPVNFQVSGQIVSN